MIDSSRENLRVSGVFVALPVLGLARVSSVLAKFYCFSSFLTTEVRATAGSDCRLDGFTSPSPPPRLAFDLDVLVCVSYNKQPHELCLSLVTTSSTQVMGASVASTLCVALFLGSITASVSGKSEIWCLTVHIVRYIEAFRWGFKNDRTAAVERHAAVTWKSNLRTKHPRSLRLDRASFTVSENCIEIYISKFPPHLLYPSVHLSIHSSIYLLPIFEASKSPICPVIVW